jgi:biopolymer transport protein ExbD
MAEDTLDTPPPLGEGSAEKKSASDVLVEMRREKKLREAREERKKIEPFQFGFTSLLDALTVILMFLLVTISSDPLNVSMDENLLLATSNSTFEPKDAIPIIVKKTFIAVDDKEVVRVDCKSSNGQVCGEDRIKRRTTCAINRKDCSDSEMEQLKDMYFFVDKSYKEDGDDQSFLIMPLMKALDEKVKNQKEENQELKRKFEGAVNIICDRDIPFRLVAEVVHSAGMAGLSNMRFAIIKVSGR